MHRALQIESVLCKPCSPRNKILITFCTPQSSQIFEMKWKFACDLPNNRKYKFVPILGAGSNNTRQSTAGGCEKVYKALLIYVNVQQFHNYEVFLDLHQM